MIDWRDARPEVDALMQELERRLGEAMAAQPEDGGRAIPSALIREFTDRLGAIISTHGVTTDRSAEAIIVEAAQRIAGQAAAPGLLFTRRSTRQED